MKHRLAGFVTEQSYTIIRVPEKLPVTCSNDVPFQVRSTGDRLRLEQHMGSSRFVMGRTANDAFRTGLDASWSVAHSEHTSLTCPHVCLCTHHRGHNSAATVTKLE